MKRRERQAVLLSLIQRLLEQGSWCGETHVQKATYFLQELLGVPLEFDFILYKHGPYSFSLTDELTVMRADSILRLEPQPYPYGPSIVPGETAHLLRKTFATVAEGYRSQVEFVAEHLGDRRAAELERLATALMVTRDMARDGGPEERAALLHELKPHVSLAEAEEAVTEVDAIMRQAREAFGI